MFCLWSFSLTFSSAKKRLEMVEAGVIDVLASRIQNSDAIKLELFIELLSGFVQYGALTNSCNVYIF
jgi:hypothetical protein